MNWRSLSEADGQASGTWTRKKRRQRRLGPASTISIMATATPARNSPHDRTLPDANVWLDAAFCQNSTARRALSILRADGVLLILDELTEREALSVLQERRLALGLGYDPADIKRCMDLYLKKNMDLYLKCTNWR
jgi:hypothetical protein